MISCGPISGVIILNDTFVSITRIKSPSIGLKCIFKSNKIHITLFIISITCSPQLKSTNKITAILYEGLLQIYFSYNGVK